MPIHVVCTSCKSSFQVSEKFAGKKGPCPKCKAIIQVPEQAEEIVIHAPEPVAAKDGKSPGAPIPKPILRSETKFSKPIAAVVGVGIVLAIVGALVLRSYDGKAPQVLVIFAAVLLGPPLAWSGYGFLRNDEYEPFRGQDLWIRALICGVLYAALWAIYVYIVPYALDAKKLEVFQLAYVVPPIIALGGGIGLACMELEYGSSLLHYGLYLVVTLALSYIAKIPVF